MHLLCIYIIIPNDTQLNLNKAKKSANDSFSELLESFFEKKYGNDNSPNSIVMARAIKDLALFVGKYESAKTAQETKNLFQMPFKEALNYMKNPNMLKANSEGHLIYKLKQDMKIDIDGTQIFEHMDDH